MCTVADHLLARNAAACCSQSYRSRYAPSLPAHRQLSSRQKWTCKAQVQTQDKEQQEQKRQGGPQQTVRRFALGSEVLESEEPFPEPAASDMWEGEVWDWLGKLAIVAVPILIGLAVAAGIFAAATYNAGADKVLKPAGEDTPAQIVDK